MSDAEETTRLPASPRKFFLVTLGTQWPEGGEGGLEEIKKALDAHATTAENVQRELLAARTGIDASMDGPTVQTVLGAAARPHDRLGELADSARETGERGQGRRSRHPEGQVHADRDGGDGAGHRDLAARLDLRSGTGSRGPQRSAHRHHGVAQAGRRTDRRDHGQAVDPDARRVPGGRGRRRCPWRCPGRCTGRHRPRLAGGEVPVPGAASGVAMGVSRGIARAADQVVDELSDAATPHFVHGEGPTTVEVRVGRAGTDGN